MKTKMEVLLYEYNSASFSNDELSLIYSGVFDFMGNAEKDGSVKDDNVIFP